MLSLQRVDIDRQDRGRVRGGGWRPNEVRAFDTRNRHGPYTLVYVRLRVVCLNGESGCSVSMLNGTGSVDPLVLLKYIVYLDGTLNHF
jgi:hypothetical protein